MSIKRSTPVGTASAIQAWRWLSVFHAKLVTQLDLDAAEAGVVPFSWFEVLSALEIAPGNRVRLKELVDQVLLTKAGVSRLIDRIEQAGLLLRQANSVDGRGMDAVFTTAGRTALHRARSVYAKTITHFFARHLTTAKTDALTELFRQVLASNHWLPDALPIKINIRKRSETRP